MIYLVIIVILTLGVSAFCSTLEAMVLSTTPVEIEALKRKYGNRGELLEKFVENIDETTSAILTANTIANTFGAALAGAHFAMIMGTGPATRYVFPAAMTVSILFFSEILPKNFGIFYRPAIQPWLVYPLHWLRIIMKPASNFSSWMTGKITRKKRHMRDLSDDEIIMLAEKGQKDGLISPQERDLIANSLSLDDVTISEIMTPRTVVMAFEDTATVSETFKAHPEINFSRIPVYRGTIDNIVGIVRRRDILTAMANDKHDSLISDFIQPAVFVPENGSALSVLRQLIKKHQKMGIVVDEFASLTGVITLEDIFEHLLGSEIFETDDIAVDMRELARNRVNKSKAKNVKNSRKRS